MANLACYNSGMGERSVEVTFRYPNGRTHTLIVQADSADEAAMQYYHRCTESPKELDWPKPELDTVLEVKPVYKIRLSDAISRTVAKKSARTARKPKPQR